MQRIKFPYSLNFLAFFVSFFILRFTQIVIKLSGKTKKDSGCVEYGLTDSQETMTLFPN